MTGARSLLFAVFLLDIWLINVFKYSHVKLFRPLKKSLCPKNWEFMLCTYMTPSLDLIFLCLHFGRSADQMEPSHWL